MDETVLLGHGSGGTMMKRIIDEVFYEAYGSTELLVRKRLLLVLKLLRLESNWPILRDSL